eukprot:Hpha_TRINITY_DN20322_c0_g1::TRINITY_DN20322_c0_g1_i1::g.138135::m.138135
MSAGTVVGVLFAVIAMLGCGGGLWYLHDRQRRLHESEILRWDPHVQLAPLPGEAPKPKDTPSFPQCAPDGSLPPGADHLVLVNVGAGQKKTEQEGSLKKPLLWEM